MVLWLAAGPRPDEHAPAESVPPLDAAEGFTLGNPGPWGQMEYRVIRVELPDENIAIDQPGQAPVRWFFSGHDKSQAIEFLRSAGLGQAQLERLQGADWKTEANGVAVEPGDELVLSLGPESRAKIYALLVEMPENEGSVDPLWFRPGQVDQRLKDSGLAQSSLDLLERLLYAQGKDLLLFADFGPAARNLPDAAERRRFVKAVCRKKTLLARLRIGPESDVADMVAYWSVGGRRKDVAPLLNAVKREGEGTLSILSLLPRFIRERLYTYPVLSSGPAAPKQDGLWSAMNAFRESPDDRFADRSHLKQVLQQDHYNILAPSQLGDLVFLSTQQDTVVHAAVYIADDVMFTKNGVGPTQPWLLMHLQDLIDTHAVRYPSKGPLKTLYFRPKAG